MRTPATSLLTLMLACGTAVAPAMANDAPWRNPGQAQSQRHEQRSNDYPRSDRRQGNDRQDNRYRNDGRRDDRRYGQQGNDRRGDWNAPPRGSHYQDRRIPPPRYMHPGYGRVGYGFQPGHVPRYHPVPARPVVYRAPPRPGYWYPGARYYDRGYAPTVVVNNYGAYGLLPPPPGYAWRRSSVGDFILVAAATGIIVDVLFGR